MAQGMSPIFSSIPDPFSGIDMNQKEKMKNVPFQLMKQEDSEWKETWEAFLSEYAAEGIYIWIEENARAVGVNRDKIVRSMQKAFERLKKIDGELYEQLVTPAFLGGLIYTVVNSLTMFMPLADRKKVLQWIAGLYKKKPCVQDMWNVLKEMFGTNISESDTMYVDRSSLIFGDTGKILTFIRNWRECFRQGIFIDMSDTFQSDIICAIINYDDEDDDDNFLLMQAEQLLAGVDGFCNMNENISRNVAWQMVQMEDGKETLLKALEKNLITSSGAGRTAERILEEQKEEIYDKVPMLILKIHGEWRERK